MFQKGHPAPITAFKKGNIPWNKGKKRLNMTGENHPLWKGGKYNHSKGYVFIYSPNHPKKSNDGYVLEHRLVMEKFIGRFLKINEIVHHKNNITSDNKIENLELLTQKEHKRIHSKNYKKENGCWYKYCKFCDKFLFVSKINFFVNKWGVSSYCKNHMNPNRR